MDNHQPERNSERLTKSRLALLIAPSGSGKTSSLKRWAMWLEQDCGWKIVWVSLRAADNSPEIFLKSLEDAVGMDKSRNVTVVTVCEATLEDGLTCLINGLSDSLEEVALIFDNYHWVSSARTHDAVQMLLDYLPPQVHVIIASRSEPPLQIPRLRVRRQLLELGMEDL